MLKYLAVLCTTLLLGTSALVAQIVPPPPALADALADLNQRVGATLVLESPELAWSWEEEQFADASLGCPQPDQMYAQALTDGYIILFTYAGTLYDYRASLDGTTLVLCSSTPVPGATEDPAALSAPAAPQVISAQNAALLTQQAVVEGQFSTPLAWSPTGQTLAVAALSGDTGESATTILLFNPTTLDAEPRILETGQAVSALSYHYAEPVAYLATGGVNGGVSILQVEPEGFDILPMQAVEGAQSVNSIAVNADGTMIASVSGSTLAPEGTSDNTVRLWNATTGELVTTIQSDSPVGSVAFSPEGTQLAYGTANGIVHLVSMDDPNGTPFVLQGHNDLVASLEFSADGTRLASGSLDGTARLWNVVADGTATEAFVLDSGTGDAIARVAFSPDGLLLASAGGSSAAASTDNAIRLWDTTTGTLLAALPGYAATVSGLAFSPDGTQLASLGDDGTLRLWGVGTGVTAG